MTEHARRSDDGEKSAMLVHLEYIRGAVDDLKKAVFGVDENGGLKTRVDRIEQRGKIWNSVTAVVFAAFAYLVVQDVYVRMKNMENQRRHNSDRHEWSAY